MMERASAVLQMSNGFSYSVVFRNQSTNEGYGCLYWTMPPTTPSGYSVAWLSKYTFSTTTVTWSWETQYDFVWSETGKLQSGTMMSASQVWPADLNATNAVTLTYQKGAYTFQDQRSGPSGSLTIQQDNTIPVGQASTGIGLAGYATYVVQAQPNINLQFTPGAGSQLWIAFGNYPRGQVIDPSFMSGASQINFPVNVYSLTATLSAANQWTVEPTSTVNARYARAREANPAVSWTDV